MADPINPRLDDRELFDLVSQQYPHLSRADILEIASLHGFDLNVPEPAAETTARPSGRATERRKRR